MQDIQALCVLMFRFTIDTFKKQASVVCLKPPPASLSEFPSVRSALSSPQLCGLVGGIPAVLGALPSFLCTFCCDRVWGSQDCQDAGNPCW